MPSGSVVGFAGAEAGQPAPASFGCSWLTTIGATQRACAGRNARAVAEAPTSTDAIPKILLKKPGAGRLKVTLIVSFVPSVEAEADVVRRQRVAVPGAVVDRERLGRGGVGRERLRAGEGGGVGRGLRLAVGAEPGADVEDGRAHPEQRGHEDDCQHRGLPSLVAANAHSTRSWVELVRLPEATTTPSTLIEYG